MDWGQIGTTPKFATWGARINYYRTHHPIMMGFVVMGAMASVFWAWAIPQIDRNTPIKKYKHGYYVYRPDDPHVKLIKRGQIGLDRFESN